MTNRKHSIFALLIIALTALLGLQTIAFAASGSSSKKKDLDPSEFPVAVQMASMLLPVVLENGKRTETTVTPFLIGHSVEALTYLCRRTPKVREAILVAFKRQPMTSRGQGKIDGKTAGATVKSAANKVLKKKAVKRGYILVGTRSIAQGVAARLPGSSRGCQRIAALPDVIAREEEKEAIWEERRKKREAKKKYREGLRKHRVLDSTRKSTQ